MEVPNPKHKTGVLINAMIEASQFQGPTLQSQVELLGYDPAGFFFLSQSSAEHILRHRDILDPDVISPFDGNQLAVIQTMLRISWELGCIANELAHRDLQTPQPKDPQ